MRVKYQGSPAAVLVSGGRVVARGETVDVPKDEADELIAGGWVAPAPAKKAGGMKAKPKGEEE